MPQARTQPVKTQPRQPPSRSSRPHRILPRPSPRPKPSQRRPRLLRQHRPCSRRHRRPHQPIPQPARRPAHHPRPSRLASPKKRSSSCWWARSSICAAATSTTRSPSTSMAQLVGHSPQGSYTLSAVEIDKVRLTKHKVELEGARYGLHFLGRTALRGPHQGRRPGEDHAKEEGAAHHHRPRGGGEAEEGQREGKEKEAKANAGQNRITGNRCAGHSNSGSAH